MKSILALLGQRSGNQCELPLSSSGKSSDLEKLQPPSEIAFERACIM